MIRIECFTAAVVEVKRHSVRQSYVFIEHMQPKPRIPVNLTTKSCLLVYSVTVTYRFVNYGTWQRKKFTFWWAMKEKNTFGSQLDFLYLLQLQYLWSHDLYVT